MSAIEKEPQDPLLINEFSNITVCIICNKKMDASKQVSMHQLLPVVKPPTSFFEGLKRLSNFVQLSINQVPQNACHTCFINTDRYLCFQTSCNKAVDKIKSCILQPESASPKLAKLHKQCPTSSVVQDVLMVDKNVTNSKQSEDIQMDDDNDNMDAFEDDSSGDESEPKEQTVKDQQDQQSEKGDFDLISHSKEQALRKRERAKAWRKTRVPCKYCEEMIRNDRLSAHERQHRGEKPYVCKVCSKSFSASWNLASHLNVHKEKLDHVCDDCGKGFKSRKNFTTHRRLHHNESTRNTCETCGTVSTNAKSHAAHLKTHAEWKE